MKNPLVLGIVIVVLVGGALWYFNSSSSQPAAQAPAQEAVSPEATSTQASQVSVSISNFAFTPGTITIHTGDTIVWTNMDSAPHTVTSDTGAFESQRLMNGQSYSQAFTSAGTFPYHCAVHPNMRGTVIVQ